MKIILTSIITLVLGFNAWSQWECPSKLAAHLDPIGKSQFLIGGELQLSTGILDGNSINTAMFFAGVDYSLKNHSVYFEGGLKNWMKYDFENEQLFNQRRPGLRELFYQYRSSFGNFTMGLQSSTFDDHYLLNERIAGLNYRLEMGRWKFNAYAGSVTKDFARNGIFCTTGFIYDLPTGQNTSLLGNKLGEKNLLGYTLTYFPNREKKSKTSKTGEDEFQTFDDNEFETVSDDEFESQTEDEFEIVENDEFQEFEIDAEIKEKATNNFLKVEKIGIVAYNEFGKWIYSPLYYTGLFASFKLPGNIYLNPEVLIQLEEYNAGLIYLLKLDKSFSLKNGHRLSLNAAWYSFYEIDENAIVLNSYSNILAGEVLRLDAANMPFYLLGMKYNIPSTKFHVKIQNAGQLNENDLNEWDLEIGRKFKNRLHINMKAGIIQGGELENKTFLARLETRFYL